MMTALDDVTVLDLSHALAGPFATRMLGDYGATIIKIESPGTGDISRGWGPPFYGDESTYFISQNRNKKSVEINLKHPEGRELFFRLLDGADVVLENMRVGALQKLGLDYEPVSARQPRIVYCSVSGFGQDGPYRDRAALDLIVQAESGLMSITGEPGRQGVRCGISIADIAAGMFAAFGIMTALHARTKTGRGQFIDVSMFDGQLSLLSIVIGNYLADGEIPGPLGTAYKALLPYQTFRTRTRDVALAIGSDKLWRAFCSLAGLESMASDPRFATNARRAENRAALVTLLQDAFLTKTYEEWEAILAPAGIPVGAINTIEKVVEHPQVDARDMLVESRHPTAGPIRVVGPPFKLSETPGGVRLPAPLLGQHTDEVLCTRLGLDDAEIERLRATGAIGRKRPVDSGLRSHA
jgi:crotonobetainyl-CoA:carnitine CoA-transferase CaiB-like acyl-CoA transferase